MQNPDERGSGFNSSIKYSSRECITRWRRVPPSLLHVSPIILYYIILYYDSYLAGRGCYEVKDADDPMKCVEVPAESVIRLTDGGQGFAKGDHVSR